MKRIVLFFTFIITTTFAFAQLKPDGTTINTHFTITDINSNQQDIYALLNSGKHIFIVLFTAQDTGNCWRYNSSHVLQKYYDAYGPSGSMGDNTEIIMVDIDATTVDSDIVGTGSHTAGNWTTGNTFPISNDSASGMNVLLNIIDTASPSPIQILPVGILLCPNMQMFEVNTGDTTLSYLRSFVLNSCFPTSIKPIEKDFDFLVVPNPAGNVTTIKMDLKYSGMVFYDITNIIGQTVYRSPVTKYNTGLSSVELNTSGLDNGVYFMHITSGNETQTTRLIVEH